MQRLFHLYRTDGLEWSVFRKEAGEIEGAKERSLSGLHFDLLAAVRLGVK